MNSLVVLWFAVATGLPEYNIAPTCMEVDDPRKNPSAHAYTFESPNEDQAMIAKLKSGGSIGGIYFLSEDQCKKHLVKYDAIWNKDKYGE